MAPSCTRAVTSGLYVPSLITMFQAPWNTYNNITVVVVLVTAICVIVNVGQKLLYRRNGHPVDRRTSNLNTYTACTSDNNLRLEAPGKLNDFASKSGWSGLTRLRKSLTTTDHPEGGEAPDVTHHRPNVLYVDGIDSVPWWNADSFPGNTDLLEKN